MKAKQQMILIAGPYRSGTGDDAELIAKNVAHMTETALHVYKMGHLPVLGEWFALPLLEAAGSRKTGDAIFNEFFHPVAIRLLSHCDAVLRIGGPSKGADEMMETGKQLQLQLYYSVDEIPIISTQ